MLAIVTAAPMAAMAVPVSVAVLMPVVVGMAPASAVGVFWGLVLSGFGM